MATTSHLSRLAAMERQITSGKFAKRYGLISPSAVKSAVNALLDKDLITQEKGIYQVYDKFLEIWLNRH